MTILTTAKPTTYSEAETYVDEQLSAGTAVEEIRATLRGRFTDPAIQALLGETDRTPGAVDPCRARTARIREERREMRRTHRASNGKVWRKVTDADPAVYGEKYLGLEGSWAWMPS